MHDANCDRLEALDRNWPQNGQQTIMVLDAIYIFHLYIPDTKWKVYSNGRIRAGTVDVVWLFVLDDLLC